MTILQKIILFIFSIIIISLFFIEWKIGIIFFLILGVYYGIFIHTIKEKEQKIKRTFWTIYTIFSIIWLIIIFMLLMSFYDDYKENIEYEKYLISQKLLADQEIEKKKNVMKFKSIVDQLLVEHFKSKEGFEYTITKIVNNFVKINWWMWPWGYARYILMYDWTDLIEIESWNSDIECEIMDQYAVPKDLYEECYYWLPK